MNYFKMRKLKKEIKNLLRHAGHYINMNRDLISSAHLNELETAIQDVKSKLKTGDSDAIKTAGNSLADKISSIFPAKSFPVFRENIEVIVVAIAVALAFRAYFLQPFKIPTGSMQPTLNGIISWDVKNPSLLDKTPIKYLKWFVTGELYRELKVKNGGTLDIVRNVKGLPYINPNYPGDLYFSIAGDKYRIPRTSCTQVEIFPGRYNLKINYSNVELGDYIKKGDILWAGIRKAGDHIFVDKVSWNFRKPHRGEIMVFTTKGITKLEKDFARDRKGHIISTHYIKRMCGLPGEKLSINPPKLIINGREVMEPDTIRREIEQRPGYAGYQLAPGSDYISSTNDIVQLKEDEYFALGDNTMNSKDSRYWGPVPKKNLVGPAAIVYWPFSGHWGRAR